MDVERIKAENPGLKDAVFQTPRADRPPLFVMNGALLAPTGYKVDEDNIVSFQMSPDYTGSPFFPMDSELGYSLAPLCLRPWPCRCALKTTVGGGMVETFAFGGTAPEGGVPGTQGKLPVGAPSKPFSLTTAVAISSFAPAVFAAYSYFTACTFNIHGQYWPVAGGKRPAGAEAREFQFGDGGNLDNSGLLPLLQRQAKNVIWIASSSDPLSQTYDFENATQHDFDPVVAGVVGQLYSAFGYAQRDPWGCYYGNNQVFKKSALLGVVQKLAKLKAEGRPSVIKEKLEVIPNYFWGIEGGYEINLVLIYLDVSMGFQQQLPEETQQEIAKGDEGAFANFPVYDTTNNNASLTLGLTAPQVNLLAAQGEYAVRQNADLIKELMGKRLS